MTLYDVLQVVTYADAEIIDAAYRRLARKYHPDVNPDPSAGERMRSLNDAYHVLSNPHRRAGYDAQRSRSLHPRPWPEPGRSWSPSASAGGVDLLRLAGWGALIVLFAALLLVASPLSASVKGWASLSVPRDRTPPPDLSTTALPVHPPPLPTVRHTGAPASQGSLTSM